MSIRKIQTGRLIEEVARSLYSQGTKPLLGDIFAEVEKHFSRYPAGKPLPLPEDYALFRRQSRVNSFNKTLLHTAENIDVLYEAMLEHVDEILMLSASLQMHLDRLKARRRRVETKVDDYLFSLYNTDGHYFSISDTFADMAVTDLGLTSAQIDTEAGSVLIPTIASLTKQVNTRSVASAAISVTADGETTQYREVSSFIGALEGSLNDTRWEIEVETPSPANEVVCTVTVSFGTPVDISRINFTPYGVTPVRLSARTLDPGVTGPQTIRSDFGSRSVLGTERMSLIDKVQKVAVAQLTLRKTQYDYIHQGMNSGYRYIFGARDIAFVEQAYENNAVFVSAPLSIPVELQSDMVIDAVSMTVDNEVPHGTNINYYVASDPGEVIETLDDLDWRPIRPLGADSGTIVHFDGAKLFTRMIRSSGGDIQLIAEDSTSTDMLLRNPTPAYIQGVDTWRICAFNDVAIPESMRLEEGINTVKIAYTPYMYPDAMGSLDFWGSALQDPSTRYVYGRIDGGNDFFYGGDIGESNVSAFIETYVDSDTTRPTFLADCSKADPNSQMWDVKVFLNGMELGYMPAGVHKAQLPWTLRQGLNHVLLLVNIPPNRSLGTINLMGETRLHELGTVKLSDWHPVSFFDLQYNTTPDAKVFSVQNGHIVSRRQPTDNFRLFYALASGKGPDAVRVRADLSRDMDSASVTPKLNSYRLRFSYGGLS